MTDNESVSPDAYAGLILAPLFITGLLLAWFGGKPTRRQVLPRIALILCAIILLAVFVPVYSDQPMPPPVNDLIFICVLLCAFFIRRTWIAVVATTIFAVQRWLSLDLYKNVLSQPGVTNSSPRSLANYQHICLKRLAVFTCLSAAHPDAIYPPGYLDESKDEGIKSNYDFDQRDRSRYAIRSYRLEPYWHTPLTGLRHIQTQTTRIWFDGGKLDNVNAYHIRGFGRFVNAD